MPPSHCRSLITSYDHPEDGPTTRDIDGSSFGSLTVMERNNPIRVPNFNPKPYMPSIWVLWALIIKYKRTGGTGARHTRGGRDLLHAAVATKVDGPLQLRDLTGTHGRGNLGSKEKP